MYYVYQIEFKELNATYIGCTNDIGRRRDQHNDNARNRKSRLGNFLLDNNIRLEVSNMKIIGCFEDRKQALNLERETVLCLNNSGTKILNNNYSLNCTRVGLAGMKNPMAKQYIFIDTVKKTAIKVFGLKTVCESLGLPYKAISATSKGKITSYNNRFLVRHIEDWDKMSEKEKQDLICGTWIINRRLLGKSKLSEKLAKEYIVETPDGAFIRVKNLDKFAEQSGINSGNLHASRSNGRKASGYKVIQRLERI